MENTKWKKPKNSSIQNKSIQQNDNSNSIINLNSQDIDWGKIYDRLPIDKTPEQQ